MIRERGFWLAVSILLTASMCVGAAQAAEGLPAREHWTYQEDFPCVRFDASVYGVKSGELPVLRASLHKLTQPEMDSAMAVLNPELFSGEIQLEVTREEWNGDSLAVKYYASPEYKAADDPNYYFYDGTLCGNRFEWQAYAPQVYAPFQWMAYRPDRLTCASLQFCPPEAVASDARRIIQALGLDVEGDVFAIDAYSLNGAAGYSPYIYTLTYRFCYEGIPISPYMFEIPTKDAYTLAPSVFLLYNEDGLMNFSVRQMLDVAGAAEPRRLVELSRAVEAVVAHKRQVLGVRPPVCREIALEYVPVPFAGGDVERDADLIPCWVFYFEDPTEAEAEVDIMLVNAITGKIVI